MGKWGDMTAIRIADSKAPEEAVLASSIGDVVATWSGGRRVHRRAVVA